MEPVERDATTKALRALADPTRFRIVEFLAGMCCGEASVDEQGGVYERPTAGEVCCYLTGNEKITSTVSHHLHELESAGIISIERQGKRMLCTLRREALDDLASQLMSLTRDTAQNSCC